VNLTDIPYDAELGWGFGQYGTPVEAYHHYVDGALQDGLFLGQGNVTTWGVKLYPVDESGTLDGLPYWGLRLLGPESTVPTANGTVALMDGEYMTFLMVTGS
jgi:hypothetical protein